MRCQKHHPVINTELKNVEDHPSAYYAGCWTMPGSNNPEPFDIYVCPWCWGWWMLSYKALDRKEADFAAHIEGMPTEFDEYGNVSIFDCYPADVACVSELIQ